MAALTQAKSQANDIFKQITKFLSENKMIAIVFLAVVILVLA